MIRRWLLVGASVLAFTPLSWSQPNLIGREIDTEIERSRFAIGPFLLTPRFTLGGGYDSNAFSESSAPRDDVTARAAPGITAALPIGKRALLSVFEELNFVYYRDLEDLRDIYTATRVGGAFGGRRFLVRIEDEFRKEKARQTSELDFPLDQRSNRFETALDLALGWRHELTLSYEDSFQRFEDTNLVIDGVFVASLLDRAEQDYRVRISRQSTPKSSLILEGFYEIIDFDDQTNLRDADSIGALVGLVFRPDTNLEGQVLLGYKRLVPDFDTQADYNGLVGDVDFGVQFAERFRVNGLYSRDVFPSILGQNLYFLEHRGGGSFGIQLASWFSIQPGVQVGRNTYPEPTTFINADGEEITEFVVDRFTTLTLSMSFRISDTWSFTTTGNYESRESNLPTFTKDRLFVTIGLNAGL